jgi:hypothetical protein
VARLAAAAQEKPGAYDWHRLGHLGHGLDFPQPRHGPAARAGHRLVARTLGASREADLYFASFTLPDFLNYLLAAGALSIVFIPIFVKYLERGDREGGWKALSVIANFILVAGSIGIALLAVFARPLAGLVAPGFTGPGEVDTLVRLIRIILPAQFFLVIGGLLSAALQAQDRHFLPAMAPLVYSAGIIGGGLVGARYPRNGSRRICLGRAGRRRIGAVRAAALRLHQDANALVPDPVIPERGPAALPLAFISDHDRLFDRGGRRVDYQKPGLVPRGAARCRICNTGGP